MASWTNLVVVSVLILTLGIWAAILYRSIRRGSRLIAVAALKRFASDFGLKFWTHASPYHNDLARLTGRGQDAISNVLLRKLGDVELVWFEVLVYKRNRSYYEPRVAIRKPGTSFPKFALAKRSLTGCVSLWMEMKHIPLEDQSPHAHLTLFGDDVEAVRRLFNPSLRERIAHAEISPSLTVRGNGDWLLFNVKGFRSFYGWPAVQLVTADLRTFLSWMGKAVSAAELFFPIEAEATKFMVPSAEGLLVRSAGRDKSTLMLILAAVAFWLLVLVPSQFLDGNPEVAAIAILLAVALSATGVIIGRLYKKALARTTDSLARGL